MSDEGFVPRFEGLSRADLPAVYRSTFDGCVRSARSAVDPSIDVDGFVEELYAELAHAFEWLPGPAGGWPADVPLPAGWERLEGL